MKTLMLSLLALLGAMILFQSTRFDFLDFTSTTYDISWDEITEDLWPQETGPHNKLARINQLSNKTYFPSHP